MISLVSMDRFCPRTSCSQCQEWDITSEELQSRIQSIAGNLTKKKYLEPNQNFAMRYIHSLHCFQETLFSMDVMQL